MKSREFTPSGSSQTPSGRMFLVSIPAECMLSFSHYYLPMTLWFKPYFRIRLKIHIKGFPHSSVGKESACNAEDPDSIPGLWRSAGEGIGYPFQYSCASLVAQLVKNPPAECETWVRSLGWEDPLEKGKAIHSSILAWRIPWTSPWGRKESDTTERLSQWVQNFCLGWRKSSGNG